MALKAKNLGGISEGGKSWSAAALRAAIAGRRAELAAAGVREGGAVALVQGNEARFFVNLLALWELGACAVPLPPTAAEPEIQWALGHSGASHVSRGEKLEALPKRHDAETPPAGSALVLYTSGSTGKPKGAVLSFAAVEAKLEALEKVLPPETLRHTLCLVPVSFGHGLLGNSLPALWSGQHLHLEPAFSRELLPRLGAYLDEHEITFFSTVPSLWHSVLNFSEAPRKGTVRKAFCASAPLRPEEAAAVRAWLGAHATFHNIYGLTEAASWVAELGGQPFGCELRVDPGSRELLLRAPYLMTGYHRDPAATAAAMEQGWLLTGDLGRIDGQGLHLEGRLKDQINRGGLKVAPLEVEERLLLHPAVGEASVFGVADPVAGEAVHAAVVARTGATLDPAALKAFCRQALSEHKVPERIHVLAELPKSGRGKIDKAALRKLAGGTA